MEAYYMNISLTPIDEAWKIPKSKKNKEQNKYTNDSVQKDMLQKSSLPLNNDTPSGNDGLHDKYQPIHNKIETNEENKSPHINITITKKSLLNKLSPYNLSYIQDLVHKGLELVLNNDALNTSSNSKKETVEKIEKFTADQELNILIYILMALLVLDILFKLK